MVGERLKGMNFTFDQFISSSSTRAYETSEIVHIYIPHLTIQQAPELKEGWPTFPEPAEGFDPTHPVSNLVALKFIWRYYDCVF